MRRDGQRRSPPLDDHLVERDPRAAPLTTTTSSET